MQLHRGDICLVNFNPAKGGEIGKLRPAIIISEQEDNDMLDTVIVVPLSTVIEPDTMPYRYHIVSREKLKENSDACIYEIRALSKLRVKEKLSKVKKTEMIQIQKCICSIVG